MASPKKKTVKRPVPRKPKPAAKSKTTTSKATKAKGSNSAVEKYSKLASGIPLGIAKALGHETRRAIIGVLLGVDKASPNELSKVLDEGLSQVSYHTKALFNSCQVIELVDTQPRRGAVEHYYSLTKDAKKWLNANK